MATAQENLKRFQEIANRGIQDQLPPEMRARFDEASRRGLIQLPESASDLETEAQEAPQAMQQDAQEQISPEKIGDQVFELTGSEELATQAFVEAQNRQKEQMPEGNIVSGAREATTAVASGLAGQIVGGWAGIGAMLPGGRSPAEAVRATQQWFAERGAPETQAGEFAVETIGDIAKLGIDVAEYPISGLAGITELVSGQGLDQAVKTAESIREKGLSQTAGDRVMEETGNPVAATVAFSSPELAGSIIPITKMTKARFAEKAKLADEITRSAANPNASRALSDIAAKARNAELDSNDLMVLNQARQVAPDNLGKQIDDIIEDATAGNFGSGVSARIEDASQGFAQGSPNSKYAEYMLKGSQGIKNDKLAQAAIKQGMGQDVVAMIKATTPADKKAMLEMTQIMKQGRENLQFRRNNRPLDVVGRNMQDRVKYVRKINDDAAKELKQVVEGLKGQPVEFQQPVQNFIDNLDDLRIRVVQNDAGQMVPDFSESTIRNLPGNQKAIKRVVEFMDTPNKIDAFEIHELKKYLDDLVTYGKTKEGLSGRTERVLKSLRHDINASMREQFPAYKEVNQTLTDTIGALDDIQSAFGKKVDFDADKLDKALGQELRKLETNYGSRVPLENAMSRLDKVSRKYGGEFDGDLGTQVGYAYELDSLFRPAARGSFQGASAEAAKKGLELALGQQTGRGMLAEGAENLVKRARGINEENAFKAIFELLQREVNK